MKLVSEILDRARTVIQDETSVRWTLRELLMWLNDAIMVVSDLKPSSAARTVAVPLVRGTLQALPVGYASILRPVRNLRSGEADRRPRRVITVVSEDSLNALNPEWHDEYAVRYSQQAAHFIFDETNPKAFYVYPGNDGSGELEMVLAAIPEAIATPADPENLASYNIPFPLDATYGPPLLDYVLYRAYTKDAQFVGNAQRAALCMQQFATALGVKVQTAANSSPNAKAGVGQASPGVAVG